MALHIGDVKVPIFARFNGEDIELGTVTVPLKLNASRTIREAQNAVTDVTSEPTTPEPVKDDAAALTARVQATKAPTDA